MTQSDPYTEAPEVETGAPPEDQTADEQGGDGSGAGETSPRPAEPTAREKDLEQRLRRQGNELATARRLVAAQSAEIENVKGEVARITDRLSANDKESAERREREHENYLNSLPPEKRTAEELRLLKAELKSLKDGGIAAQARKPAAQPVATEEPPEIAYMRARAQEILTETQDEFGVELTQEDIAPLAGSSAWDSEESFTVAITKIAARKSRGNTGGNTVAEKKKEPETEAQMRERITREVQDSLGAGSPATPRAAGRPGKRPTDEDVHKVVETYNSAAGPKASIAKLKQMREQLHKA
jgi:uncharacterized coiled-coil protein SlyX